jgi:hypothetical protein
MLDRHLLVLFLAAATLLTVKASLSITWLDRAWTVAFITSLTSMILALFGSGWPRILLLVSSLLCLVLAYGSMLQNGI